MVANTSSYKGRGSSVWCGLGAAVWVRLVVVFVVGPARSSCAPFLDVSSVLARPWTASTWEGDGGTSGVARRCERGGVSAAVWCWWARRWGRGEVVLVG